MKELEMIQPLSNITTNLYGDDAIVLTNFSDMLAYDMLRYDKKLSPEEEINEY